MKAILLKQIAHSAQQVFDMILDDPEVHKYIRDRANKKQRAKISAARHDRLTMTMDSKKKFLTEFRFEKVQEERWRLRTGRKKSAYQDA